MPITQARMSHLIAAARDFEQSAESARRHLEQQWQSWKRQEVTAEQALEMAMLLANPRQLMTHLLESHKTLDLEEYHLKKSQRVNETNARRQAERREELRQALGRPIPTHNSAPDFIDPRDRKERQTISRHEYMKRKRAKGKTQNQLAIDNEAREHVMFDADTLAQQRGEETSEHYDMTGQDLDFGDEE